MRTLGEEAGPAGAAHAHISLMAHVGLPDDPLWYKDAIIYELRLRAFYDSDSDGVGDFAGVTEKLDYLHELGVTAVWILPFYPSPLRDDGYDISDTMKVHPDVGTLEDFRVFLREAHARGIRVITELVLNHLSDQHQRFQIARRAPKGSPERDFFVWSDDLGRYSDARIIFKDFERSNWTFDSEAQSHFWHRFYSHQPDLNYDNPEVRRFVRQTLDFWLDLGVDGIRLDAVPYLHEREGTSCENLPETHAELRDLRAHIDARYQNRMLLAEANQWPEDAVAYFGQGDECHMAFHFPIMPRLFMAIRMEDRFPLIEIVSQTPAIPESCQWALFLRNHDELTLEMVTDEERDYMYRVYAQDPQARINLGIRHRLAPLMNNDRRRMELLNGLLFSLPGTPVLYYGDEIGMGDNIFLGDRNGVRTPMQWSADRNAGFSRVNPQRLFLPVITDPEYHYEAINVENQRQNPSSLLRWTRALIALRKDHVAFSRGTIDFLYPENRHVLTFLRTAPSETLLVVANMSGSAQYVELDLARFDGWTPVELFGRNRFPTIGELPYLLTLAAHGFYWFQLEPPAAIATGRREGEGEMQAAARWTEIFDPARRDKLNPFLLPYLRQVGWYTGSVERLRRGRVVDVATLRAEEEGGGAVLLVFAELLAADESVETVFFPLSFAGGEAEQALRAAGTPIFAKVAVREGAQGGVVYDAARDARFGKLLEEALTRDRPIAAEHGVVEVTSLRPVPATPPSTSTQAVVLRQAAGSTRSTSGGLRIALYHSIAREPHPDIELSTLLQERCRYPNMLPLLGFLEYRRGREAPAAIAAIRMVSPTAIDCWELASRAAERFIAEAKEARYLPATRARLTGPFSHTEVESKVRGMFGPWLEQVALLGQRTAELHRVFAKLGQEPDLPEFAPEPYGPFFRRSRYQSMRNQIRKSFELARRRRLDLTPAVRSVVEKVVAREEEALDFCKIFLDTSIAAHRLRHHGRWRLRELLYDQGDFYVPSFEGEPSLPLSVRRNRRSPIRDVVHMMRGLRYAAFANLLDAEVSAASEAEQIEPLALVWQCVSSEAFLGAYFGVVKDLGFLPRDPEQLTALFQTYLLEEYVFSMQSEMIWRPTWVWMPAAAILEMLG